MIYNCYLLHIQKVEVLYERFIFCIEINKKIEMIYFQVSSFSLFC